MSELQKSIRRAQCAAFLAYSTVLACLLFEQVTSDYRSSFWRSWCQKCCEARLPFVHIPNLAGAV